MGITIRPKKPQTEQIWLCIKSGSIYSAFPADMKRNTNNLPNACLRPYAVTPKLQPRLFNEAPELITTPGLLSFLFTIHSPASKSLSAKFLFFTLHFALSTQHLALRQRRRVKRNRKARGISTNRLLHNPRSVIPEFLALQKYP